MVEVKLSVKERDHLVKYNPFQPVTTDSTIGINDVNFHMQTLVEEVTKLPKKEINKYKKQLLAFQASLATFMMLPLKSMANVTNQTVPVSTLPNSAESIPPEIMELLIGLLKISVAVGVILAAILLVASGIGRMFRMKDVTKWTTDIIRGLVQILLAVPVVFIIYYVATLIFKGSGWFVSPF